MCIRDSHNMAQTITHLYPIIFDGLREVSRELHGFIPAVNMNASAERVAKGQAIEVPIVGKGSAKDISPSNISSTGQDHTVSNVEITISKSRAYTLHLTGEGERGLDNANREEWLRQVFAEGFRAISNEVETLIAELYYQASRAAGTVGTTPFTTADSLGDAPAVMRILDENGAPKMNRQIVLGHAAMEKARGQPSFVQVDKSGDGGEMLRYGQIAMLGGLNVFYTGQVQSHAKGDADQAINNSAGYEVGTTELTIDGGAATEDYNKGDIVTIGSGTDNYVVPKDLAGTVTTCLLYTSPSPRDRTRSRMPSSA